MLSPSVFYTPFPANQPIQVTASPKYNSKDAFVGTTFFRPCERQESPIYSTDIDAPQDSDDPACLACALLKAAFDQAERRCKCMTAMRKAEITRNGDRSSNQ